MSSALDCDFSPSSPHLLPNGLFSPQNRISFELLALSGLSGFSTFKGGKMLIFQGLANSCIVREFPPFSFKVRIATLTRNAVGRLKTGARVRISPSPPKSRNNLDIVGCKSTVPRCCGFFIFKISEVQKKMPNGNFLNRMDLNSGFRLFETQGSNGRPFSSPKGRSRTEKLYTKNRAPVCWYQRINRPGFFVFRRK